LSSEAANGNKRSKGRDVQFRELIARASEAEKLKVGNFTVVFYGLRIFDCKTAHFCGTQRECGMPETPSFRDAVQRTENTRKNSFLN
jgi:hypothetical protein